MEERNQKLSPSLLAGFLKAAEKPLEEAFSVEEVGCVKNPTSYSDKASKALDPSLLLLLTGKKGDTWNPGFRNLISGGVGVSPTFSSAEVSAAQKPLD